MNRNTIVYGHCSHNNYALNFSDTNDSIHSMPNTLQMRREIIHGAKGGRCCSGQRTVSADHWSVRGHSVTSQRSVYKAVVGRLGVHRCGKRQHLKPKMHQFHF